MLTRRALACVAAALAGWPAPGQAQRARAATDPPALVQALAAVNPARVAAHVRFLSDDLLEGRAPGTRGGELAARYLAAQFAALGLTGGGADGSFYQWLPLVGLSTEASVVVGAQRSTLVLDDGQDVVAWPERADSVVSLDAPIVFLGHGITAPEWDWDDYHGAAVTGRIVMVLANDPGLADSTIFHGRGGTWYGSWRYKIDQAARMGAAGVLLVHSRETVPFPWATIRTSWSGEHVLPDQPAQRSLRFAAWITADAARRIVEATGKDYALVVRRAEARGFTPIDLGARAAVDLRSTVRRFPSANVIGEIPGRDSLGRREAIILAAHYDHLGVGPPESGDSIYNGAVDNASGVGVLLAAATAMAGAGPAPRRSVLFLLTTAGEAGELGAQAYVAQPSVPLSRTAAMINVDGADVWGPSADIVADGARLSQLDDWVAAAAQAEGLQVTPDPYAGFADLYRSDQLPLAQAGVPVVLLRPGTRRKAEDATSAPVNPWLTYLAQRYHRPGDEVGPEFDYRGAAEQTRFLVRLVWSLAESQDFPEWRAEAEFRAAGRRLRPGR